MCTCAQGDHKLRHDITVPPFHGQQVHLNRWLPEGIKAERRARLADPRPQLRRESLARNPAEGDFKRLLFFSGKMNLQWGRHYSLGVRQAVAAHDHEHVLGLDVAVHEVARVHVR